MSEPTGLQCRICEGDMVPEISGDNGDSAWMECCSCGNTERLDLMKKERLVNSPMRRERDELRATLRGIAGGVGAYGKKLSRSDMMAVAKEAVGDE